MRSRRPYLLRAMYEWMLDSQQTPHILVDARQDGVAVPEQSVHDGRIVLNIGRRAAQGLVLGNEALEFDGRFGGVARHVSVPVTAVLAIYARETGQGMMFGTEDEVAVDGEGEADAGTERPKGRPTLKLIK